MKDCKILFLFSFKDENIFELVCALTKNNPFSRDLSFSCINFVHEDSKNKREYFPYKNIKDILELS